MPTCPNRALAATPASRIATPSPRRRGEADAAPSQPSFILNLVSIARKMRQLVGIELAAIDLQPGQDQLLLHLDAPGRVPLRTLVEQTGIRQNSLGKTADALIAKGFVLQSLDPADRRRRVLALTPEGVALAAEVRRIHAKLEAELQHLLGRDPAVPEAAARIEAALSKAIRRLR